MKTLTSLERVLSALNLEKPDRVPVVPELLQHVMKLANVRQNLFSTDASVLAKTLLFSWNNYRYDGVYVSSDNWILAEAMGVRLDFPKNGYPEGKEDYLLKNLKDLDKLFIPDPYRDARMPLILKATKIVKTEIGKHHFIETCIDSGPFQLATTLRGINNFMVDLYTDENKVFDLLELCTDVVIRFGKSAAKSGAHAVQFGEASASSSVISPEFYEKFALPFEKRAFEEISKAGVFTILHICGDTTPIIGKMAESGADCLEIDSQVDLGKAKRFIGDKVCLKGNISTSFMLTSNPREVYRESIKCIKATKGEGFILSGGCEIPRDTPPENIEAMIKASQEYKGD